MPQFKLIVPYDSAGQIDVPAWLAQLRTVRVGVSAKIRPAVEFAETIGANQATPMGVSCLQAGIEMANILVELQLDDDAMAAALLYSLVHVAGISLEDVAEQMGEPVAKLLRGTFRMEAAHLAHGRLSQSAHLTTSVDNLRKMLLAMVDDVRVVLIKFAERLAVLKHIAVFGPEEQKRLSEETMVIYAPLANRLGVGHLKWQLEDYAFRYLEPARYKSLSKSLKERRLDREAYVVSMHQALAKVIDELKIREYEISGRVKHIFSIYRKMQRKNLPVEEIYDVTALRVLVNTVDDCYAVLGAIQSQWTQITKEYDDYIANPKPNGYRSLHTAVVGPSDKIVEIQIRTKDMHQEAELGVAAHWLYKEGAQQTSSYEAKIAWLRQVMDWQKDMAASDVKEHEAYQHIFDDRVYVFTPGGDVLDLPKGATPLDFAYTIHSEVGHRCKGAKANDAMVPLTYVLQMGDVIEIMTAKSQSPSRDWLNPHKGYITSARARAKVHHYFRQFDFDRHRDSGDEMLQKDMKKAGLAIKITDAVLKKLHYQKKDDLLAAIGRGDIGTQTVLNTLSPPEEAAASSAVMKFESIATTRGAAKTEVVIEGVENLLTHMAGCCHPIPGDPIVGYVTLGKGVSIHRQNCGNLQSNAKLNDDRVIRVDWGDQLSQKYAVNLLIMAHNSRELIGEINNLLAALQLSVMQLAVDVGKSNVATIHLTVQLTESDRLPVLISQLQLLPDVKEVKRQ